MSAILRLLPCYGGHSLADLSTEREIQLIPVLRESFLFIGDREVSATLTPVLRESFLISCVSGVVPSGGTGLYVEGVLPVQQG